MEGTRLCGSHYRRQPHDNRSLLVFDPLACILRVRL